MSDRKFTQEQSPSPNGDGELHLNLEDCSRSFKSSIPIVCDAIRNHHQRLRSFHTPRDYQCYDSLLWKYYYKSLLQALNEMQNDPAFLTTNYTEIQKQFEYTVYFEKLKSLIRKNEVLLNIPSMDAVKSFKEYGGYKKMEQLCAMQNELFNITNDNNNNNNNYDVRRQMDVALPFIMAEYKNVHLFEHITSHENFDLNVYSRLALSEKRVKCKITNFTRYMVLSLATFSLQITVLTVIARSLITDRGYPQKISGRPENIMLVSIFSMYMFVHFWFVELKRMKFMYILLGRENAWRNPGFIMDFLINGIGYVFLIIIQNGVMLTEKDPIAIISGGVALLFILRLDDEIVFFTDDTSVQHWFVNAISKQIYHSALKYKSDPDVWSRHCDSALNPDLEQVDTYIVPHFEWYGPQQIDIALHGSWREDGWNVEFIRKSESSHDDIIVTFPEGNETIIINQINIGTMALLEHSSLQYIQNTAKRGLFIQSGNFRTESYPSFGRIVQTKPDVTNEEIKDCWVTELKEADDIVLLHCSVSPSQTLRGGVFLVKGLKQKRTSHPVIESEP